MDKIQNQYILNITNDVKEKGHQPFSIENGYFIFTLMPSLRCSLNCPHCYLSLDQRRNSPIMKIEDLKIACEKVNKYYDENKIKNKVIIFYWYGGEPTEMGIEYFTEATQMINDIFKKENGYTLKHTVLTSLLNIDTEIWFPFFRDYCDGHFQTSFDGLMRGKGYVRKWQNKVKEAIDFGLTVGTISVVNEELIKMGARETVEYLSDLGVGEISFLPFMWNEQNNGDKYNKYAPTMEKWNNYMIEASQEYFRRKDEGVFVPEIGQLSFSMHQEQQPLMANIAAQTLFLLPDGDFVLPDYKNGYQEYMRSFGNILTQEFKDILRGKERKSYLRKQVLRDGNLDCLDCELSGECVMEFWKQNREGDECFGGKRYILWLKNEVKKHNVDFSNNIVY